MKKILVFIALLFSMFLLVGCTSANRVSYNLGIQAEEFRILRRIAAINGFTDKPVFEIVGYCSIESDEADLAGFMEITCKNGVDSYAKHFIYMGDNVNIVVDQIDDSDVPQYHYQIIFAPQALLPIPEIITDIIGE